MKNIQKIFRILSQKKVVLPTIGVLILFTLGSILSVYVITWYVRDFWDKKEKENVSE